MAATGCGKDAHRTSVRERGRGEKVDRTTIDAEPTPATTTFMPAVEAGDWATALQVLDEHWVEIWFAVDPADLRRVVAAAPPDALAALPNAGYLARTAGHGLVEDLLEPEPPPRRAASPAELARYIADLRLRGRPALAMTQVRRAAERVRAQRGRPVDGSGGAIALWLVQAALTALLAGEVTTAKGLLLGALDTHRPDRFPFVVREATAKLALAHAMSGDVTEALQVNERARALSRTQSWVERMVDDTISLTDYICAVDMLDPRAEDLRRAGASPLAHGEFWPVALEAHVRHLTLTGRSRQADELCDAAAAAGLPPAGADGVIATAVSDARVVARADLCGLPAPPEDARGATAQVALARALHLFTAGRYPEVTRLELPATFDDRLHRAHALLRAQATVAEGRVEEGRRLLLHTLREVLDRGTWSTLRYLTRETLGALADSPEGARAVELVERHGLATVEVRAELAAPLSDAEVEVLQLLREGLTREEIAQRLFLSVNTVKTQLRSAYRKLGVSRRPEALEMLARLGL